jgi:hypothetical protein
MAEQNQPQTKRLGKLPETIRISLEDNDKIPPTGQFIGINGKAYMLKAGQEVDVPIGIIEALDNAVESVPELNASNQVVGWRSRLRFPYRVIRRKRGDEEAA